MSIFITSDWHFCHNKEFLYVPRGFNNEYDMNNAIINNHNSIITQDDDIYCLGDVMLSNGEIGLECLKQLNGKIHIIIGNHDTDNKIEMYKTCPNVVEVCAAARLRYKGYHFFLSHYPCLCGNYDDGKYLKQHMINLCGHVHTQDPFYDWDKGIIFHCEIDTNNCYPWLLDDIIEKLKEKYNSI